MPKGRDKTNAMLSDLDAVQEQLKKDIADIKGSAQQAVAPLHKALDAAKKELRDEIRNAVEEAEKIAKAAGKKAGKDAGAAASQEVAALRETLKETAERVGIEASRESSDRDEKTRQEFAEELMGFATKADEELAAARSALEDLVAKRFAQAGEASKSLQALLEAADAELARYVESTAAELRKETNASLMAEIGSLITRSKQQDQEAAATRKQLVAELKEQKEGLANASQRLEEEQQRAISKLESELERGANEAQERLRVLDETTDKALKAAYSLISDVENVPTKKVDWVIRGASQRLKPPRPSADDVPGDEPPFSSWITPRFDAAGARDLQLELRVYRAVSPPAEGQERGDCAVFLTAPKGTNIACRLYVGTASQAFEKRFAKDRELLGTGRLCFLEDQIDPLANKVRISVEVLECIAELEKPVAPKPGQEEMQAAEDAERGVEGEEPLESIFLLHRHINNRVLSQVRTQVEHIKSRTVRRVEWRLEEASRMRRSFPRGSPMKSREFEAAGLEGLQLLFYPSGYDGASDGYCSLFLRAPGGASLRCWLQAGPERRELSQTWEREGQCGRANFCRFESCVDAEDDTVLVVLEIESAQQDVSSRFGHFPPPIAGIRSLSEDDVAPVPLGSVMKLHRGPIKVPPELQEVKVLPAITAARNRHDPAAKLYSSSSCGALRERRHGGSDSGWRRRKPLS